MIFLTRYFLNRTEINTFSRLICVNLLRRNFIIKLLRTNSAFFFILTNMNMWLEYIFSMCVLFSCYILFSLVEYNFDIQGMYTQTSKMNRDKSNIIYDVAMIIPLLDLKFDFIQKLINEIIHRIWWNPLFNSKWQKKSLFENHS